MFAHKLFPSLSLAAAVECVFSGLAAGQITFDQEFDSGNLDTPASSVNMANPAAPVVTIKARGTKANEATTWWWSKTTSSSRRDG